TPGRSLVRFVRGVRPPRGGTLTTYILSSDDSGNNSRSQKTGGGDGPPAPGPAGVFETVDDDDLAVVFAPGPHFRPRPRFPARKRWEAFGDFVRRYNDRTNPGVYPMAAGQLSAVGFWPIVVAPGGNAPPFSVAPLNPHRAGRRRSFYVRRHVLLAVVGP